MNESIQDALMRAARAVGFFAECGVTASSVTVTDPELPRVVLVDGPALRRLPAAIVHGAQCGVRGDGDGDRRLLFRAEVYGCAIEWEGRRHG